MFEGGMHLTQLINMQKNFNQKIEKVIRICGFVMNLQLIWIDVMLFQVWNEKKKEYSYRPYSFLHVPDNFGKNDKITCSKANSPSPSILKIFPTTWTNKTVCLHTCYQVTFKHASCSSFSSFIQMLVDFCPNPLVLTPTHTQHLVVLILKRLCNENLTQWLFCSVQDCLWPRYKCNALNAYT